MDSTCESFSRIEIESSSTFDIDPDVPFKMENFRLFSILKDIIYERILKQQGYQNVNLFFRTEELFRI